MHQAGKTSLICVQLIGLIISAMLVGATFLNPDRAEERLRSFAIAKVEQAAEDALGNSKTSKVPENRLEKLMAFSNKMGLDAQAIDLERNAIVPSLLALSKSKTCGDHCEFWEAASNVTDSVMLHRISELRIGQETLGDFVVGRYESSIKGLLLDLRRFGLINAVVLALMLGLVIFQNHLNWRFTAFSVALTSYTAWSAYGYVFKQDWAFAILTQDWAAPGYQATMIFFACLFFDWLLLKGRITDFVASAINGAIGF